MKNLTPQDHADIAALTGEILHLIDHCRTGRDGLKRDIAGLLARRILEAQAEHEAQLTAEETHSTDRSAKHHISDCSPNVCGRYQGQRRDTPLPGPMGTGLVNDDDTETLNFADESDYLDRP